MARKNIELGVIPTGQGGDTFRSAMTKINGMTEELYTAIGEVGNGAVKSAAGVKPDATGDIPKAALATAIGLDSKADKSGVETALNLKADKTSVSEGLSLKADKATLDSKVDKVAGKTLSSNDYTTLEKTKLADMVSPMAFGLGSKSLNVTADDVTAFAGYAGNTAGFPGGNGQVITMVGAATRRTRIATDHDVDTVYFQRMTDTWQPWRRFLLRNDYGLGADPRSNLPGDQIAHIDNISTLRSNGKYRVSPATVGGPGVYGTLDMNWYDATNWTMVVHATDASVMAVRGCVNGAASGWVMHYAGSSVKKWVSDWRTLQAGATSYFQHNIGIPGTSYTWQGRIKVATAGWQVGSVVSVSTNAETAYQTGFTAWELTDPNGFRIQCNSSPNLGMINTFGSGAVAYLPWANVELRCIVVAI
ncbi:hypothetical protein [Pseudomonas sp. KCJK8993]|uniref:hypothetical protein n=1 Tax=Pseudomonas sp. KCJK8993 TaxID=3344565 RepID=UPI003906A177